MGGGAAGSRTIGLHLILRREPRWVRRGIYLYLALDSPLVLLVFAVLLAARQVVSSPPMSVFE